MRSVRNDFPVRREVEASLTDKLGREVTISSVDFLGGGCIHHASKIGTNAGIFFLKWNANCPADMFLREAECLDELRKAADGQLVVPKVIASRQVDDVAGFLVLEYLEPGSSGKDQDERLGRGLAGVHQFTSRYVGFKTSNYCGLTPQNNTPGKSWPEFFRENRLRFLLNLIQKERPLPDQDVRVYERLLDRIHKLLPEKSTPALIHGDLWSGNYMYTTRGPALIDPASYYADREMEMGIMTLFGGFSALFYQAYNEVNPLPPDWQERNRLYQLYHVLNHYYIFGGGYRNHALQIAQYYAGT